MVGSNGAKRSVRRGAACTGCCSCRCSGCCSRGSTTRESPELFGIPFFYWYQMAWVPISVVLTILVYRATTKRMR